MTKYTITTKTPEQIAAEFAAAFAGVEPSESVKPLTQKARLEPYRVHIMRQRRRGLTWQQIAERMSLPPINEPVTWRLLQRVFGGTNGGSKRPTKSASGASTASPKTAQVGESARSNGSTNPVAPTPASQNAPARSGPRQPYVIADPATNELFLIDPVTRKPIRSLGYMDGPPPGRGAV